MSTRILDILDAIAATTKRTEKEAILTKFKDNDTLKRVFQLTYDRQVLFYTKQVPEKETWGTKHPNICIDTALDRVEAVIVTREVTGNAAARFLEGVFAETEVSDAEVLKRVILGDLRIGATESTANKIWKNLIPVPKFMLAQTDAKKIVYPAYSQVKEDGTRCKFIWDGYDAVTISRNGNPIEVHNIFNSWATRRLNEGDILDGELVAFDDDGNRLSRKVSNGIINKAVQGTISKEEAKSIRFIAWDFENMGDASYEERFNRLTNVIKDGDPVVLIESKIVNDEDEAMEHFKQMRRLDLEGTMLKNMKAPWQPKRSFDVVKYKAEFEAEFKVNGYELGKGKNENRLGALLISSADDLIESDVGIFKDFPDSVRDEWLNNLPKIVTVRYNMRISTKGKRTTESLFLPRVISVRYDKVHADTRDQIIEMEENTIKGS